MYSMLASALGLISQDFIVRCVDSKTDCTWSCYAYLLRMPLQSFSGYVSDTGERSVRVLESGKQSTDLGGGARLASNQLRDLGE